MIPLKFTLIQNPGGFGFSLYLNAFHIAGPKPVSELPYGGGKVIQEWMVDGNVLLEALNQSTAVVTNAVSDVLRKFGSKGSAVLARLKERARKPKSK